MLRDITVYIHVYTLPSTNQNCVIVYMCEQLFIVIVVIAIVFVS